MQLSQRNVKMDYKPTLKKHNQAKFRGLFQAAAFIRTTARRSIKKNRRPSPAGGPPHTQTNRIRDAMRFDVNKAKDLATIGAVASIVGPVLGVMERGGKFRGTIYDRRPTMMAALTKATPRLPEGFRLR